MHLDPQRPLDGGAPPDGDFARYVERMVEASRLRLAAAARADVKATMVDVQAAASRGPSARPAPAPGTHAWGASAPGGGSAGGAAPGSASPPASPRDAVALAVRTLEAQAAKLRAAPDVDAAPGSPSPGRDEPPDLAAQARRGLAALGRAGFIGLSRVLLLGGIAWLVLGGVLGLAPFADTVPLGMFAIFASLFMRQRRG